MNDQTVRDLLHEVADDLEPGDRLDAIRAATAPTGRRTHRGWWAAGGAGLLAASVATAFALTTGGAPQSGEPDVADPAPTSEIGGNEVPDPVAVYFVGDAADGERLYREFQPVGWTGDPWFSALNAALLGNALDPDYRSAWPRTTVVRGFSSTDEVITLTLEGAPVERPDGMSETDARLAIEQLIRTAQALHGQGRVPVDIQLYQQVTDTVLGVPTTTPLTGSPDSDVLAPVSLSDPYEGQVADNDESLVVRGAVHSSTSAVITRIQRWEGNAVISQKVRPVTGDGDHMVPFSVSFDLTNAPPGDYDVISEVQNADGTVDTDTRRITVVD